MLQEKNVGENKKQSLRIYKELQRGWSTKGNTGNDHLSTNKDTLGIAVSTEKTF